MGEDKPYMLLMVYSPAYDQARRWFEGVAKRYSLDTVFIGDIKPRSLLQEAVGFTALIKLETGNKLWAVAQAIDGEVKNHEGWRCEFMRADRIEVVAVAKGRNWRNRAARRVDKSGCISIMDHEYFVTKHLAGEEVNLRINGSIAEVYRQGTLLKSLKIATDGINRAARRVNPNGCINVMGHKYFVTKRLRGEEVTFKINDSNVEVYHQGTLLKSLKIATDERNWRNEAARRVNHDGRISIMGRYYFVTKRLRGEEVTFKINDNNLDVYHQGALVKCLKIAKEREGILC